MSMEDRIGAIRAALALTDVAISETEAALLTAAAGDKPSLRSSLVGLRAQRTRLQLELDNLEAAAVGMPPFAAARAAAAAPVRAPARGASPAAKAREKKRSKELTRATLKLATDVEALAKTLRTIGDDPTRPVPKRTIGDPTRRSSRSGVIGDDTTRPVPRKKPPR